MRQNFERLEATNYAPCLEVGRLCLHAWADETGQERYA